jgi:hypothetical protein
MERFQLVSYFDVPFCNFENRDVHDVKHNYKIIYTLVIIDTKDLTPAKIGE